ncbi:MAG: hypothetical protein GY913_08960 [Proteobacteria bacterium]|nr:hypothetical protein [Pseudomonadota bacterium]MCP4917040.1 hypothetical protein [Pseudomonadota bacterium]
MSVRLDVLHSIGMPSGDTVDIVRRSFEGGPGPRVAIVAGIRGDAPEGVRVAHAVGNILAEHHAVLNGRVDLFPCVNPLAAHRGVRNWPFFDQDLNRRFPGKADGHAPDVVAWKLTQDLADADHVIELRGAHPAFAETAQAHVRSTSPEAAEAALHANVNLVWVRDSGLAAPSTFAAQFADTITLEGGTGNRLTPGVGQALAEGVLNLLNVLQVLPDDALPFHWAAVTRPVTVTDDQVHRVRAGRAGLFLPKKTCWDEIDVDEVLGEVISPTTGDRLEEVRSAHAGRIAAMREQPVVFPGTMVARIVELVDG